MYVGEWIDQLIEFEAAGPCPDERNCVVLEASNSELKPRR